MVTGVTHPHKPSFALRQQMSPLSEFIVEAESTLSSVQPTQQNEEEEKPQVSETYVEWLNSRAPENSATKANAETSGNIWQPSRPSSLPPSGHLFANCIWEGVPTPAGRLNPYHDRLPPSRRSAISLEWRVRGLLSLRQVCRRWETAVTQVLRAEHEVLLHGGWGVAPETCTHCLPEEYGAWATLTGQRVIGTLSKVSALRPRWHVTDDVIIPACSCGAIMAVSDFSGDGYQEGWACDSCDREVLGRHERWCCRECSRDYCFRCRPEYQSTAVSM